MHDTWCTNQIWVATSLKSTSSPMLPCFAQISSGFYGTDKGAESYLGGPILVQGDKHAPGRAHNSIWSTDGVQSKTTMTSENACSMITAPTLLRSSKRP